MIVKATIVLGKEWRRKAGPELVKEIQTFVKTNTAPYKYPRSIEFVKALPKTISGKIRRVEIRENDKRVSLFASLCNAPAWSAHNVGWVESLL